MRNICKNCGAELIGKYCHQCSQENKDLPKFMEFMNESLGNILEFDFKVIRSLKLLILRPGLLTLEYWEGKTIRQTKPLRLLTFALLFMILLSSLVDFFSNTKIENSSLVGKYLSFILLPVYAILLKFIFRKRKQLHFTHFFIFSIHWTAGVAIIGTPFLFLPLLFENSNLVPLVGILIHNIYQFFCLQITFKLKLMKALVLSFGIFIIDGILSIIVMIPLTLLFPEQFSSSDDLEKMLSEGDITLSNNIEKIENKIDSLKALPFFNEKELDSLIQKRDKIIRIGNPMRKLKEKGDQLKSRTKILN